MKRRGFLGLLGKLVSVGTAISLHPALLRPLKAAVPRKTLTAEEAREELRKIAENLKLQGVKIWTLAS